MRVIFKQSVSIVMLCVLILSSSGVAQSVIQEDVDSIILVDDKGNISLLQNFEVMNKYSMIMADDMTVWDVAIYNKHLYAQLVIGNEYARTIGTSRIIEINLETLEQKTLFEKENIWDIYFSPDYRHAVVTYESPDIKRFTGMSPRWVCILNLETEICDEFDISPSLVPTALFTWINDAELVYKELDGLYVFDVNSYEKSIVYLTDRNLVNVGFNAQSNVLLLSMLDSTLPIFYLDLTTSQTHEYPLILSEGYIDFYSFRSFSPDGNYFILNHGYQQNSVIDFSNGEQLFWVQDNPKWSNDSRSIVWAQSSESDESVIVYYNLISKETTTINIDQRFSFFEIIRQP